ncbi:MAG TPA: TraB/GumN family protein [Candidatus Acidoferrales bacterium]|nr:TraB/GumN family protein [Candidatus Acidoferrales bacterium]
MRSEAHRRGQSWRAGLLRAGLALWLLCGLGQPQPHAEEQAAAARQERSSFWRVRSGKGTVYMLGSVHLLKPEHYPLSPAIEKAFASSARLVLEVNLDTVNAEGVQQAVLARGRLEPGQTLRSVLRPASYALLKQQAEAMGVPLQALETLKPWLVALTLTTVKLRQLGYDPEHGIDRYFLRKAKEQNKQILGLETLEFQVGLLDQMTPRLQELFLLQTLEDLDVLEQQFARLVDAWKQGDAAGLEKILMASFKEYPEVYERMVVDRNRKWLAEVEKLLEGDESALVVVGAGHLVGKEGLIELLRARGYAVEQW